MENTENKKTINNKAKSSGKKNSTSIPKVKSPIEGLKMISVPQNSVTESKLSEKISKTKKKLNDLIKPLSVAEESSFSNIVETINNFNTSRTRQRQNNSEYAANTIKNVSGVNYFEILKEISDAFQDNKDMVDLFGKLSEVFVGHLKWSFVGFGLLHEKSKCINLKVYGQGGNTYSSKIFLSDDANPIVECFKTKNIIDKDNLDYLNIPYLVKTDSVIVPMISVNKCIGVMLVGQNISNINVNIINFFSNYAGMYIHNAQLLESTSKYANTDTLTSLYNHRGFQEILAKELEKAKQNNTPLSIIMFDVNNISKINREVGHAKGYQDSCRQD